jgi:two-component system NtrC family sensor kinase
VSSVGSLDATLRLILAQAVKLLRGDHGYLLLTGASKQRTLVFPGPDTAPSEDHEGMSAAYRDDAPEALLLVRDAVLRDGEALLLDESKKRRRARIARTQEQRAILADLRGSLVASPLRAFGKSFGVVLVTRDGTGRRFHKSDRSLLRILADNASCAMRNLALYEKIRSKNEKLRQSMEFQKRAQRRLIEAEKLSAMREMVSGVAHELNNPLTSILGYVQLLDRSSLEEKLARYVKVIFGETERCRSIVQDFLAFARKEEPDRTIVRINELVPQILSMRKRKLKDAGITVTTRLGEDVPRILGDPHHLQQALLNSLRIHEALCEPGPSGEGAEIHIETWFEKGHVHVRLRSTGSRIPTDRLSQLLDPFSLASDAQLGSSLSLCVVRDIVTGHGGDLEVDARDSGGLITVLSLPAEGAPAGTGDARPHPVDRRLALSVVSGEDRQVVREVLEDEGLVIEEVDDTGQLVHGVTLRAYDLVVVEASGLGAELKSEIAPLASWCPHIVLHGTGDTAAFREFPCEDGHVHLPKPLERDDLRQVVSRSLRQASGAASGS